MTEQERQLVLRDFRVGSQRSRFLITTDELTDEWNGQRGTTIVNYDMRQSHDKQKKQERAHDKSNEPLICAVCVLICCTATTPSTYLHRIGRVDHLNSPKGVALNFVTADDTRAMREFEAV